LGGEGKDGEGRDRQGGGRDGEGRDGEGRDRPAQFLVASAVYGCVASKLLTVDMNINSGCSWP